MSAPPGMPSTSAPSGTPASDSSSRAPADDARPWPSRLPLFSVLVDADGEDRAAQLDALAGGRYPFWEVLLHRRAPWPPAIDPAARMALRGDDRRIRLAPSGAPAALLAAAGGSLVIALGPGQRLEADALFNAARLLDGPTLPDRIALAAARENAPPVLVCRKAALLDARAAGHGPARAAVEPAAALSIRTVGRGAANADAIAAGFADRDVLPLDAADETPERLIDAVLRGRTAEHVLLLRGHAVAASLPDAATVARARTALAVPGVGAVAPIDEVLDALDGTGAWPSTVLIARATLRRLAALPAETLADGLAVSVRALGLVLAPDGAPARARGHADAPSDPERHRRIVAASGLLDVAFYRAGVPEVADPVGHWCAVGWRDGRAPNAYFDPAAYRARHMADAGDLDPLLHWIRFRRSGVRPSDCFDPAHVRWTAHLRPEQDPLAWFLAQRHDGAVGPVPGFDPVFYRRRRPDLLYQRADPFDHYLRYGVRERTDPSAGFETAYYLARHMSWSPATSPRRNPLLHWLAHRDQPGIATSSHSALRSEADRRHAAGGNPVLPIGFAWFDGLPQRSDALRALLGDKSIAAQFVPVLGNAALLGAPSLTSAQRALIRAPFADPFDDGDIADRLAECLDDERSLRRNGMAVIGVATGGDREAALGFATRVAGRLGADGRRAVTVEPINEPLVW